MRRALGLLAAIAACCPATTYASQSVRLHADFTPEHLGQGTTIDFGFEITTPANKVPPPLTNVEVSYPVALGFPLSELGLATCSTATLETFGPEGCPANSLMGYGIAHAEIPLGPTILHESAHVTIIRTTEQRGHLALLIYAIGETPVVAQVVLSGLLLPAPPPFGGRLDMQIPLVPTLPEAPDAAVVQFSSTLGPLNLHYQERIRGRLIDYKPRGIPLPNNCPPAGFPFSAKFAFQGGSHSEAAAIVPCPSKQHHYRRG